MHNRPATRSVVFGFPTNDGLFAVFVAFGAEQLPAVRADLKARFMAAVDQAPELAARVRAGRREGPIAGATDLPNFLRKPYGPGWALVGDAGAHKDPFLALGMCDAFRDADLLAAALHRHFADARAVRRGAGGLRASAQRGLHDRLQAESLPRQLPARRRRICSASAPPCAAIPRRRASSTWPSKA